MGELLSGNTSDREWNPETVKKMRSHFEREGYKDIVYVGDSATVSSYESLKELAEIKFISRFPENFKIVEELKVKALKENNWEEVKDKEGIVKYKVFGYTEKIEGKKYRFIVVNSKELREKKEKTIGKRLEKNRIELEKKIKSIQKKSFACHKDAERFLEEFMKEKVILGFVVESKIEERIEIKHEKKGRPGKEEKGIS